MMGKCDACGFDGRHVYKFANTGHKMEEIDDTIDMPGAVYVCFICKHTFAGNAIEIDRDGYGTNYLLFQLLRTVAFIGNLIIKEIRDIKTYI